MTFPPLLVTQGVPDPSHLSRRLKAYGFSHIDFIERMPLFPKERPRAYLQRVMAQCPEDKLFLVYLVVCGQRVLGIPATSSEAETMLHLLSGRRHQVWVSFFFKAQERLWSRTVITRVSVKRLTLVEMKDYIASQAWKDRTGGYSAFDEAAPFIKSINGSASALAGLPEFEWSSFLQNKKF